MQNKKTKPQHEVRNEHGESETMNTRQEPSFRVTLHAVNVGVNTGR